jgi:hypothetical protein
MKNALTSIVLLVVLMTAGFAAAQETRAAVSPADSKILCPFPFVQHIAGGTGASAIVPSEFPANIRPVIVGSVWNQTQADKNFGHTFRFEPKMRDCCVLTGGILSIKLKALVSGPGVASSVNDGMHVYVGGVSKAARTPWTSSVHAGDTQTMTIPLTAGDLSSGLVSIYFEDDRDVVSADLELDWCCLTRRP